MDALYETDVLAWAGEQVALLRSGQLFLIDVKHIAEQIEDVGKSEKRELASRFSLLLAQLLQWRYQPARRGASWRRAIAERRNAIALQLKRTPSLQSLLGDADWLAMAWSDAVVAALKEAGLDRVPPCCPWPLEQILIQEFLPE